jgi:hypothetical protein
LIDSGRGSELFHLHLVGLCVLCVASDKWETFLLVEEDFWILILQEKPAIMWLTNYFPEVMFNINDGYLEGLARGFKGGILTRTDYLNLVQCETIDGEFSVLLESFCLLESFFHGTMGTFAW